MRHCGLILWRGLRCKKSDQPGTRRSLTVWWIASGGADPSRGEIWTANLDPTRGHEQAGDRPVLIVSTNRFNHGPADLVLVAPLTRTARHLPFRVQVDPPEGGLPDRSYVLCDSIRSVAKERLDAQRGPWGVVSVQTLGKVEDYLRILLEL